MIVIIHSPILGLAILVLTRNSNDIGYLCYTPVVYILIYTVFIRIEARASIFYIWFLTRRLNESGVYLNPGVNFRLFTCPG